MLFRSYHNLATPRSASIPSWARDDRSDIDRLRRQGLGSSLEQSIRMIAESQTQLIQSLRDGLLGRQDRSEYKQKLTSIVVDKWSGGKGSTAKQYRAWKKRIQAIAIQYGLKDTEVAFLITINCTGVAREALEIFEPEDFKKANILEQVWQILDQNHEELDHISQDDAYKQWETAHRKHGESMNTWINNLKKIKLELEAQDPEINISRRYYASKLMRGSGLNAKERATCLHFNGGVYDPIGLMNVLRTTYSSI